MAAIRTAAARIPLAVTRSGMEGLGGGRARAPRYFSDSIRSGRVLSEEERAAENVYIQKMEREKLEKLRRKADQDKARRKADQDKADAAKRAAAAKGDKKGEGAHPS